jgi:hypothetical protein
VNLDNLAIHVQQERYGDFWLTQAIRPAPQGAVIPEQAYRIGTYQDDRHDLRVPVLAASVSREKLFDAFLALLEPLGDVVDVVLETSHHTSGGQHRDILREHIDRPVLSSHFCEFEDLLVNDGCTGVAVIATDEAIEVQFDEHKLLIVYAQDLKPFEAVLRRFGVLRNDALRLISEGVHLHNSDPRHPAAFQQVCYRLGVGESAERVNW